VHRRSFATLPTFALPAVLLVGCTMAAPEADQTPAGPPRADLCAAAAPPGAASEAVTVEGAVGEVSTLTFEAPLEIDRVQASVIHEGSGEPVESGQLITYAFTSYRADNGQKIGSIGYGTPQWPVQISPESQLGLIFGCASPGTRVVAAFPSAGGWPEVGVFDFLAIVPSTAWGEPQEPVPGMPTVTLAEDGRPTVELPGGQPPTAVELAVLKRGEGETIAAGRALLVQYIGVKWSDGSVFDSSWESGEPAYFPTSDVVDSVRAALEGQTVGSQIIILIPPEFHSGAEEWSDQELAGETLVFVVDILGAQPAGAD
jgi:hypothetical protein